MTAKTTQTVILAFPIPDEDGGMIGEVTVRRPKGRDVRALDAHEGEGQYSVTALMISLLTGLTVDQVDELDASDVTALSEVAGDFFDPKGA